MIRIEIYSMMILITDLKEMYSILLFCLQKLEQKRGFKRMLTV